MSEAPLYLGHDLVQQVNEFTNGTKLTGSLSWDEVFRVLACKYTVGYESFDGAEIGVLRDQICTTQGPQVDCVTFDERVVLHCMEGVIAERGERNACQKEAPPPVH